jgi:hypothetical protein
MTTLVIPIKPFRAWRYFKDSTEPAPDWVDSPLPRGAYARDHMNAAWLVDLAGYQRWYTPAEFAERFKLFD